MTQARTWLAGGSSESNPADWPKVVQDALEERVVDAAAEARVATAGALSTRQELEALSSEFAKYKARAHTALKKATSSGADDKRKDEVGVAGVTEAFSSRLSGGGGRGGGSVGLVGSGGVMSSSILTAVHSNQHFFSFSHVSAFCFLFVFVVVFLFYFSFLPPLSLSRSFSYSFVPGIYIYISFCSSFTPYFCCLEVIRFRLRACVRACLRLASRPHVVVRVYIAFVLVFFFLIIFHTLHDGIVHTCDTLVVSCFSSMIA